MQKPLYHTLRCSDSAMVLAGPLGRVQQPMWEAEAEKAAGNAARLSCKQCICSIYT